MNQYYGIFEWEMSQEEANAYKLARIWEDQTRKTFPDHQGIAHLPTKGDPRKSNLFRHCWKLVRETRGLLRPEDYKFFILANLQILRANHARVDPNCICGDKAWIRWIVWKKLYDRKVKEIAGRQEEKEPTANPLVVKELALTKKFLFEKCEGEPSFEKIAQFIAGPRMKTWVNSGKVSRYYVALSPWVARSANVEKLESKFQFDFELFLSKAGEETRHYFQSEFSHEWSS